MIFTVILLVAGCFIFGWLATLIWAGYAAASAFLAGYALTLAGPGMKAVHTMPVMWVLYHAAVLGVATGLTILTL